MNEDTEMTFSIVFLPINSFKIFDVMKHFIYFTIYFVQLLNLSLKNVESLYTICYFLSVTMQPDVQLFAKWSLESKVGGRLLVPSSVGAKKSWFSIIQSSQQQAASEKHLRHREKSIMAIELKAAKEFEVGKQLQGKAWQKMTPP